MDAERQAGSGPDPASVFKLDNGYLPAPRWRLHASTRFQGHYDAARDRLRPVLASQPNSFDALSVMAYVEAQLQDYAVAAEPLQESTNCPGLTGHSSRAVEAPSK